MITVIDLNLGNVASVDKALKHLNIKHVVSDSARDIQNAEKIIFPGVGNFFEAAKRMKNLGLADILKEQVIGKKIPLLGICLGMQLLAGFGEEGGGAEGLNFINGEIKLLRTDKAKLRLPHIGWNDVNFTDFKLFTGIKNSSCFYFVHSYEMILQEEVKIATSNYGVDFVAAIQKGNIMGVQFHPEKSQEAGLCLLNNFCRGYF